MPRITVQGKSIYFVTGELFPDDERKVGPLLLFIHGAGHTGRKWRHQVERLGRDYYTMAVDLPGHGESEGFGGAAPPGADGPDDLVTVGRYAAFVAGLWEAIRERWVEVPGLILAGHSMGGAVAIEYALSRPRDLVGLVLISTGARLRVHPDFLAALRRGAYPMEMVSAAYGPYAPAALIQRERKEADLVPPDIRYRDFLACNAFDRMHDLGRIGVPTLVLTGERDRLTPPKFGQYLAERIPGARMVTVEGAGHMVMLESPDRVSREIDRFVAEILGQEPVLGPAGDPETGVLNRPETSPG